MAVLASRLEGREGESREEERETRRDEERPGDRSRD
jgi:hypothetical protein